MRYVDTQEYVSVLRELVEEGKQVNMLIAGNSMSPFIIHQRDYIYFQKPDRELKVGDPVFYQRDNGQYVMHRICKVNKDGTYNIVGDAQYEIEHGVRRDQIFALITQVRRKNQLLKPGDFWWDFFEKVYIRIIPFRKIVIFLYKPIALLKHLKK
ncbi:MAG: S24/S26 family peptidase [Lachnospiraceae bacterium]|nr:S24/S26 family peptidase [Lachnospiraceae bacterium]